MIVRKNDEELVSKFERFTTADPRMTKVPDSTVRNARKELIDIADLYPEGRRAGSFDSVNVPFVPDECFRRENGFGTAVIKDAIIRHLNVLTPLSKKELLTSRFDKYAAIGAFMS